MQWFLLSLLSGGGSSIAFAEVSLRCDSVFTATSYAARLKIIEEVPHLELSEMLLQFKKEGKLIYQGDHEYQPGTEFLASNEFDWLATPFDHKPADVLVAFGTNSAWEIAVDKNVKSLYLGDWSPYPLLASAYIVEPLIKLAKTPKEFLILLSGRVPTKELLNASLDDTFKNSSFYAAETHPGKVQEAKIFLEFLAHQDLSEFELKFLTSYFYGLAGLNAGKNNLGPFSNLHYASYAKLLSYYDQRYSPLIAKALNENVIHRTSLRSSSTFSSQKNFDRLRSLFVTQRVRYAMASITDMNFYKLIQVFESSQGHNSYALSLSNIFDCGHYNCLSHRDLQNYLLDAMDIFKTDPQNPLVVFRTANPAPPHNFLRYDLKEPSQVKALRPETPQGE
ncbi:MAG: hypothetical protein ACXWRE_10230 [Pseudobdellovibrionaceae bacterium]